LTVSIAGVTDADNPGGAITGPVSYVWQVERRPGTGVFEDIVTMNGAGDVIASGTTFTPGNDLVGLALRVKAVYKDANGVLETVFSAPTAPVAGVNAAPTGLPAISDTTPTEGLALTAITATIMDPDGTSNATAGGLFTFQWQQSADGGVTWEDIPGATDALFVPGADQVGLLLRVVVSFLDDEGNPETVVSAPTQPVADDGVIILTEGADIFTGTEAAEQIWGLGGDDVIFGLGGNDQIFGGLGNDFVDGGTGADEMWDSEGGDDTYVVDDPGDQVFEFDGQGTDTIQTTLNSYTLLGPADGLFGEGFVENLTFIGTGDFTGTGNELGNVIVGGIGNDTLDGGAGNDTLDGGAGADAMTGGAGDDTYVVDNAGDQVNEASDGGTDTVRTVLGAYALGANLENLTYTGAGNFAGIGNALDNAIAGNGGNDALSGDLGNDTLNGGGGNDSLSGGDGNDKLVAAIDDGNDSYNGGTGIDTYDLSATAAGATVTATGASSAQTGTDSLTGIENVVGSQGGDTINLNGGVNVIDGQGGNDTVNAGGGSDTLVGGTGNDTLGGGAGDDLFVAVVGDGNDTYNGGNGVDTYDLSATSAGATVTTGSATSAETGTDVLNSIANVIGSQGDDLIVFNGGANLIEGRGGNDAISAGSGGDVVDGGDGNDTLNGGAGNDTVNGGAGDDAFTFNFGDGVDAVDGGTGSDTLNILGTAGGNTLNVIFDGAALTGFEGGTVTNVEAINASLLGGTDTLTYAGTTAGVTVDLGAGTASGFASIAGIENVTGGSGDDILTGGNGANVLTGGAGDDTYFVGQGDTVVESANGGIDSVFATGNAFTLGANVDNLTYVGAGNFNGNGNGLANVLTGNDGNDFLNGNGGSDTLVGNGGNDNLNGGGGSDILIGGAGNDAMNGGTGADTFVFAPGFGNDVVSGFDANPGGGQDRLDLSALGITAANFAASVLVADLGANTLVEIDVDGLGTVTGSIMLQGVNGVGANVITQQDFILA
jgi:Ca2+-binding RTX toxin-like protein